MTPLVDRRSETIRRALVLLLLSPALLLHFLFGYIAYLNLRMSRELLGHQWRTPTEIYTVAGGKSRRVLRVYGTDWRVGTPLRLDKVPERVANAFIAAEDLRFRSHVGIDPIGMVRALFSNVRSGGIVQGGSTINQQLVKTKFLTQERTYRRKILEVVLAVMLDMRMSKDEILEAYLNDVYLGHINGVPVLGVDEASRLYFNKTPANLSVDEAAILGSIIRAPNRDNPEKRPELVRERRNLVLERMKERRWISESEFVEATRRPVRLRSGDLPEKPFPYYLAALRRDVIDQLGSGVLSRPGLRVTCEIDTALQRDCERAARRGVQLLRARHSWIARASAKDPLQAAILSVDPRSGGVRALVGGADFRRTQLDRTLNMKRQPGSAFKPFAYLAAIVSRKATASTLLLDSPLEIELSRKEVWQPHNYDEQYRGRVTLRESLEKSLNVPTVRLTERLGTSGVVKTAKSFGFTENFNPVPALPLGVTEVTMRELVGAYTAFPSLGIRREPYLLREVHSGKGKLLYRHDSKATRAAEPAPMYVMHTLLRGVVKRGTASRLSRYGLQHVAGKTGTTNDYRDAWFVGYTPELVTAAWVGFDRGAPLRLSSAEAALPIWAAAMSSAKNGTHRLDPPEGVVFRDVDPESGYLWQEGCPGPIREVYLNGTAPIRRCPRGLLGRVIRRALFDKDHFDEPAAITFDKFRQWTIDAERSRKDLESVLDKVGRILNEDPDARVEIQTDEENRSERGEFDGEKRRQQDDRKQKKRKDKNKSDENER